MELLNAAGTSLGNEGVVNVMEQLKNNRIAIGVNLSNNGITFKVIEFINKVILTTRL